MQTPYILKVLVILDQRTDVHKNDNLTITLKTNSNLQVKVSTTIDDINNNNIK